MWWGRGLLHPGTGGCPTPTRAQRSRGWSGVSVAVQYILRSMGIVKNEPASISKHTIIQASARKPPYVSPTYREWDSVCEFKLKFCSAWVVLDCHVIVEIDFEPRVVYVNRNTDPGLTRPRCQSEARTATASKARSMARLLESGGLNGQEVG